MICNIGQTLYSLNNLNHLFGHSVKPNKSDVPRCGSEIHLFGYSAKPNKSDMPLYGSEIHLFGKTE